MPPFGPIKRYRLFSIYVSSDLTGHIPAGDIVS